MNDSIKEQVQRQFSRNAQHYVASPLHAKGGDLSYLVSVSEADGNMEVLDIATGGGHVANALAPLVRRVTACDLTKEMLEAAAAFIRGNGHSNVDFVEGDAERLPFPDGAFDLVTCRIAAHHFPDVPAFAAESFRVLKPGGRLLLIDNVAPENGMFDRFYNEVEKQRDPSHVRAWTKTEWIRLLEVSGFRVDSMVRFPKMFQFRDWCGRAGLPKEQADLLESKLLQAPEEMRRFFSVQADESGNLVSFGGESACFRAIRP
ncbi:class I SAM-dependent methyltransferase [Paenibacillus mesophilus]|uniref:class I SAM-dependent methyltransferase n=1 Tax=Paenibacillus mesophilus TaxID=2582849 RepID=UPI00110ECF90|nr:class I SAM-dependent methyltransferase [Paenibacillus mesophilus]TMV46436.1 class I SAM-dependent methyltransferase [Paenibacillus mesophilus]